MNNIYRPKYIFVNIMIIFLIISTPSLSLMANPADSLLIKGREQLKEGNFLLAEKYLRQAYQQKGNFITKAKALNNLGVMYQQQSMYDSALSFFSKSEKIFEEENRSFFLTKSYNNKAIVYKKMKDYERSLEYYEKALTLCLPKEKFSLLNNIGSLYFNIKQPTPALSYFKRAEAHAEKSKRLKLYKNIATTLYILNKQKEAKRYFEKAFCYKPHSPNHDYIHLLIAYGMGFSVKDSLKKAIEQSKELDAYSIVSQAQYYLALTCEDKEEALSYLKKAMENDLPENSLNAWLHIDAITKIANIYYEQGKLKKALIFYQKAIEKFAYNKRIFISNEDKKDINDKYAKLFIGASEVCIKLYEQEKNNSFLHLAFDYADMIKASIFKEQVKNKGVPDSLLLKERRLNAKIKRDKDNAVLEKEKFLAQIKKEYPIYYENRFSFKKGVANELIKKLDNSQQIISYVYSDSLFLRFMVDKKGIKAKIFQIGPSFKKAIDYMGFYIRTLETNSNDYQEFIKTSNYLYPLFFEDNMKKELIIIPWKKLYKISFDCLFKIKTNPRNLDFDLPYLVYKHAISYQYAAGLLNFKERRAKTAGLFAPDYRNTNKEPINIDGDLKALKRFAPPKLTSSVELSDDIFHLTVHGKPGYVFTKQDSISTSDISSMESTNLLTMLTACYGAEGDINAEGKESFARALLQAGSQSVIVSEWNLISLHNQMIFDIFYKELKKGEKLNIALQKGKIHYLDHVFAHELHPNFWSSLSLYGNTLALRSYFNFWYVALGLVLLSILSYFVIKYLRS